MRTCVWEVYIKRRREAWGKPEDCTSDPVKAKKDEVEYVEQLTGNGEELKANMDALDYTDQHYEWDVERFSASDKEKINEIRLVKATVIQDSWRALKSREEKLEPN